MFCKNCGAKIEDGSLFCNVCGTEQNINGKQSDIEDVRRVYCNKCGQQILDDSKFCCKCGSALNLNSSPSDSDNEKTSNKEMWIAIAVLLFFPIISWTFFFDSLALTILGFAWIQGKKAFQYKKWVKLIAIIVIACISFALVAGVKGEMQIEKKNKSYKNTKYSLLIGDTTQQSVVGVNFN